MIPFFKELFEYSQHFNQKLAEVFNDRSDMTSEKSVKLFNHILNAHQIWNNRIDKREATFGVWDMHALSDLKTIDKNNYDMTLEIMDKFDLYDTVSYTTSKGQAFNNSIRDILFHVINHSTHHRAQIATEFKQHGLEPLVMDYIFYKR